MRAKNSSTCFPFKQVLLKALRDGHKHMWLQMPLAQERSCKFFVITCVGAAVACHASGFPLSCALRRWAA